VRLTTRALQLDPDRLLPAEPGVRTIARRIYDQVRSRPIISPHGHVDPQLLVDDASFTDPTALFITPDHYVTRLLHADGVALSPLGVGEGPLDEARARQAWRELCTRWDRFAGTAVRTWLEAELVELFDVEVRPSAESADALYDHVAERLARPELRPRALYERFGLSVLATTDDPCSDLAAHAALAADPTFHGRVIPTFRPDRYLEPAAPEFLRLAASLGEAAGSDTTNYGGYLEAIESRRRTFIDHGATSADHSHADVGCEPLTHDEATRIYHLALEGDATVAECVAFRRHMLGEMARMSCEDGLVMTRHPGVRRNHHTPTHERYGPDTGHDIPLRVEWTDALRPILQRFGIRPDLHLVCFTLDETVWSRELAPLAGFYPSVFVGVPWWFLDAPDAMRRFHAAVTETVGFSRLSGFVDDTRALCSIPARHDVARRVDAGVLARLVAEHRLDEEEALRILDELVGAQPTRVFKLGDVPG
jgi:glucuronate isomerase